MIKEIIEEIDEDVKEVKEKTVGLLSSVLFDTWISYVFWIGLYSSLSLAASPYFTGQL